MGGQSYERYVKKGTPCWKVIVNILFSHVGLVLLVIGYAAGGAKIFMWLEQEREELAEAVKMAKTRDVDDAVSYLKQQFWQYGTNEIKYNYTRNEFKDAVYQDLKALERFVLEAANKYGYDGTMEFSRDFSFASSLLFTITIMTTVGYGHISPGTMPSKMFCIVYALVGIPLMLVFMGKIGDWLAVTFRWLYSRVFCRCCRARRRDSELPPDVDRKGWGINNDEVGKERYMPTDLVMVPIMINLMVIFIFIFLGALMFSFTSGWDPVTSAYFCFVTLTTIGFGDFTPVDSFAGFESDPKAFIVMVLSLSYLIFGMILISMCLNLMQEQIIEKFQWLASSLGGKESDEEVVKLSKNGMVSETPHDKNGNDNDFGSNKKDHTAAVVIINETDPDDDGIEEIRDDEEEEMKEDDDGIEEIKDDEEEEQKEDDDEKKEEEKGNTNKGFEYED